MRQASSAATGSCAIALALVVFLLLAGAACAVHQGPSRKEMWGPFRGQFIDADTGQPIRGGVAYAIWYRIVDNPVQSNQEFYAVQFGITNERGEYEIPALPDPPMFSYRYDGPFRSSVVPAHQRIDTTGDAAYTISRWRPFHRIPETQRKYSTSGHYTASIPEHREREMLQQINVIRTQMGLPPFQTLRGGLQ